MKDTKQYLFQKETKTKKPSCFQLSFYAINQPKNYKL